MKIFIYTIAFLLLGHMSYSQADSALHYRVWHCFEGIKLKNKEWMIIDTLKEWDDRLVTYDFKKGVFSLFGKKDYKIFRISIDSVWETEDFKAIIDMTRLLENEKVKLRYLISKRSSHRIELYIDKSMFMFVLKKLD